MTAAAEQMKITEIRLRRLFVSKGWPLEQCSAAAPRASAASAAGVRAGLLHSHLGAQRVPRVLRPSVSLQAISCVTLMRTRRLLPSSSTHWLSSRNCCVQAVCSTGP